MRTINRRSTSSGSAPAGPRPSPATPHGAGGFTAAELLIAAILLVTIVVATVGVMLRGRQAQAFVDQQLQVTTATQDLVERIRGDASSSLRLFQADAEGVGYLNGLERSAAPGLSGARLPRIVAGGFGKDKTGSERSGNVLCLAMHDRTDTFDLSLGAGEPRPFRVNVYRVVAYYLTRLAGKDPARDVDALDLVRWVSVPLADLAQIEAVVDLAERTALLRHLWSGSNPDNPLYPYSPVRHVWRPGAAFDDAFREVAQDGALVDVGGGFQLPADRKRTHFGLLGYRRLAVASNVSGPERGIAAFALPDSGQDGFPHGFETQIVGPASARQVLVHLTVVSQGVAQLKAWLDLTNVTETRDL